MKEPRDHARALLKKAALLNQDLQGAMSRAFRQAMARLEQAWWQTTRGHQMRRQEPDRAEQTATAFQLLQEHALAFCPTDWCGWFTILHFTGGDPCHRHAIVNG
jgi:hypothetical protein